MAHQIGTLYQPDPDSPMVAVVAPTRCRNGHPLGPYKVMVGWVRCGCGLGSSGGHNTWECRTCGDIQWGDGHIDDTQIANPSPGPSPFMPPTDGVAGAPTPT